MEWLCVLQNGRSIRIRKLCTVRWNGRDLPGRKVPGLEFIRLQMDTDIDLFRIYRLSKWKEGHGCTGDRDSDFAYWAAKRTDTEPPETSGYLPGQRWILTLYVQAQQDLKIEGCLMKAAGGNEDSVYEGACRQMDGGLFDVSFCREWGAVRILAKQYPLWMGKRRVILCLGLSDGASRNSP